MQGWRGWEAGPGNGALILGRASSTLPFKTPKSHVPPHSVPKESGT